MSITDTIVNNNTSDIEINTELSISTESSDNDEKCSICLSSINTDSYTKDCNHTYCRNCIEEWFDNNHTDCPMCRSHINECLHNTENTKIKIYFLNNGNNENNVRGNNRLELENRILRNVVKRYNCSLCFVFGIFLWEKISQYNCINNYNLLKSEYDILSENYKELNSTYNNLYASICYCI